MARTGMDERDRDTRGASDAADFLAGYGWAESTWNNRASQLARWLAFRDEEGKEPLPELEGGVLAYIGYLSLQARV